MDMVSADINNDGRADIVVAGHDPSDGAPPSGLVSVYLGSAVGVPVWSADYPAGARPYGIAAGDVTGDGNIDVVTTSFNGADLLAGAGDGTFAAPVHIGPADLASEGPRAGLRQPVIADLNGDGRLDIAAADYRHGIWADGSVDILRNDGGGTFTASRTELGRTTYPERLSAGDLNGDGHVDLIAVASYSLYVLLGSGDTTFAPPVKYTHTYTESVFGPGDFPAYLTDVTIGDFNGDGKNDVAATQSGGTSTVGLWFFPGLGDGRLDVANGVRRNLNNAVGMTVTSADVDGDGRPDVAVMLDSGAYSVALLDTGPGTDPADPWPQVSYHAYAPSEPGYAYSTYPSIAAADVNGDGMLDLVTLDRSTNAVVVRLREESIPPVVTGTADRAPDVNGIYTSDFTVNWTATDPAPSSGAPYQPSPTHVTTEGANLTVTSGGSIDPAGNFATGTFTYTLDKTPPGISVVTPAEGATFVQGDSVSSNYSCSDSVAGVAACTGTSLIDTASTGPHTFTVTATDNAGLTSSKTVNYDVNAPTGSVAATVSAGGTVTTDPSGAGATPTAPVQTALTSPVAGAVSIDASGTTTVAAPASYDLIGQQLAITAPLASVAQPLRLVFTVDGSKLGLQPDGSTIDASNLTVIRDGVPITADCDPASPGQAVPDPCVASRTTSAGDAVITILSSHASTWNFGHRQVFRTSSPFYAAPVNNTNVNVAKAGSVQPLKFSLRGNQGLKIFAAGSPSSTATSCSTVSSKTSPLPAGSGSTSTLTYDKKADQYTYSWKTNPTWAGTCRTFRLELVDGTVHQLRFAFVK